MTTPFRFVQQGSPDRPLVLGWLIGPAVDPVLRVKLPGFEIRMSQERDLAPAVPTEYLRGRPLVLIGWSAGVQSIRALLRQSVDPWAVIALDGTAADYPTPASWQIDTWRDLTVRARKGDCCAVLTCTSQLYTETIPKPFMATRHVLERASGSDLTPPERGVTRVVESGMNLWSYWSKNIDGAAHIEQVTKVLPEALDTVREWFQPASRAAMSPSEAARLMRISDDVAAGRTSLDDAMARLNQAADEEPVPPTEPAPVVARLSLGERALAWSVAHLGLTESPPGSNAGPEISLWLAACERNGRSIGIKSGSWCAAMASAAQASTIAQDDKPAHGRRAAVHELVEDARTFGTWRDLTYTPKPGDLAVFKRNGADPRLGGEGHVGRVESVAGSGYTSIDGNHNDRVARVVRSFGDPDLVGFIAYGV